MGHREAMPAAAASTRHARDRNSSDKTFARPKAVNFGAGPEDYSIARSGYLDDLMKRSHGATEQTSDSTGADVRLGETSSRASGSMRGGSHDLLDDEIITTRFRHVVMPDGHAIITGRDADAPQRCEDEPIHIPGAVQGFGLLIALREEREGIFVVRVVGENAERIIGYSPRALFRLESFCDILSEGQRDNFLDHVDFIRDGHADVALNGPELFILSLRPPGRRTTKVWCAMHINDANPDLIICEFELDDDPINPLFPTREMTPEEPEDTLGADLTAEEYEESTSAVSKPLRVLRRARKRSGEAAAIEVFNVLSQVQEQLASAPTLDRFLKVLVGVVRELTGFHRSMIYQLDPTTANGRVVAELVDPSVTRDFYMGLNFPASDIPQQARDLYKLNRVRLLYDRDQVTARLVCRAAEDLTTPLDLTYSYLRAMSPIHIKYLTNMSVRASMSISINAFGELWGLIACHAYGPRGMRVSFPIRKVCRLVGDAASRNIERLSYASRLQARKLINTTPTEHNPTGYIVASSEDLLQLFDADFGVLAIRDETKIMGKVEHSQEVLAMLEYIRLRRISAVISSHDIRADFPDLRYPPGFQIIAGLLLVPLSAEGEDFIVFFRRSQLKHVRWAGNPYEKSIKEGTEDCLEPRKSFKAWTETVMGKCRDWTEQQIETAAVLCLVYGKFIAVWRQKEAVVQRSQLTRLLLANSAHEVRTPLNAIINYLEIALEGNLDTDTREYLTKSHSASKSLICVINDLLDLTKAEEGQTLVKDEIFDLCTTVRDATEIFLGDAARKQIRLEVFQSPEVPHEVMGDQRRVRQAVSNLVTNAIQHTATGGVRIETGVAHQTEERVEVDIIVEDTGAGLSSDQVDSLFREMEQVQTFEDGVEHSALSEHGLMQLPSEQSGEGEKRGLGLGLGLATVARIVRNMEGQLRVKSEPGKGSRFIVQLPFLLPHGPSGTAVGLSPIQISAAPSVATTPPVEGEVMLINHTSPKPTASRPGSMKRQGSAESKHSLTSIRSFASAKSAKSDVDRLISLIQEAHYVNTLPTSESGSRRGSHPEATMPSPQRRDVMAPASQNRDAVISSPGSRDGKVETVGQAGGSPTRRVPGFEPVVDTKTPMKAVRVREEYEGGIHGRRATFDGPSGSPSQLEHAQQRPSSSSGKLNVLVAEDDPINSKIVKKRLEKFGYIVTMTVNGEDCARAYKRDAGRFHVILMDMQVSQWAPKLSSRRACRLTDSCSCST